MSNEIAGAAPDQDARQGDSGNAAPAVHPPAGDLKAPFPAIGGKGAVADYVWGRLGDPRNFVEPFCFSAAMLLRRPKPGAIETINDLNAYVANFWRAVQAAPAAVAEYADWPVNEVDLHARHYWLLRSPEAYAAREAVRRIPDFYDAKLAGWWAWGACCWIGSGWCDEDSGGKEWKQRPQLGAPGQSGIHVSGAANRGTVANNHRPQLGDAYARGRGVNANDEAGTCQQRRDWLTGWMHRLADRLRPVRVCCGEWRRVCDSETVLTRLGTTAVFLDPPYAHSVGGKANRAKKLYANDAAQDVNALVADVQEWALEWGPNPEMRIAVCGLAGEYPKLEAAGWDVWTWRSSGYGNRTESGKANAARERIWFSPHCIPEASLFSFQAEDK